MSIVAVDVSAHFSLGVQACPKKIHSMMELSVAVLSCAHLFASLMIV